MTYAKIKLTFADELATITLADPATMNAAGVDTVNELADAFGRFRAVAVVEEHSVIGGLGSAVAEWLVRRDGLQPPLVACGTPDAFISEAGSQQWMREQCGLTGPAVAAKILARLGKSP